MNIKKIADTSFNMLADVSEEESELQDSRGYRFRFCEWAASTKIVLEI